MKAGRAPLARQVCVKTCLVMSDRIGTKPMHGSISPPSYRFQFRPTMFKKHGVAEMSMTVFHLMQVHQKLDEQISAERKRRLPDIFRINNLKKLKLRVKDRLARLGTGRNTQTA
jgi:hypothetical protein